MDHLHQRLEALEHEVRLIQGRLRLWRRLTCGVLGLGLVSLLQPWELPAQAPPGVSGWNLVERVRAVERKLTHVTSVPGEGGRPEVVITGANLRIVNGLRGTATANGVGNLLVGYNEPRHDGDNERTGSHNVVVGMQHNFSHFGGLVVGRFNEIRGAFAVVSGGLRNHAFGSNASICGGEATSAFGSASTVCGGGLNNIASGFASTVSGGSGNTASGDYASVSGGRDRTAEGEFDWVAGPLFADE
jgi:hypothetical protein